MTDPDGPSASPAPWRDAYYNRLLARERALAAELAELEATTGGDTQALAEQHRRMDEIAQFRIEVASGLYALENVDRMRLMDQRSLMIGRTVTSLAVANGVSLGFIMTGIFQSTDAVVLVDRLLPSLLMFLTGLLAAGLVPLSIAITASQALIRHPGQRARSGRATLTLIGISLVMLALGAGQGYASLRARMAEIAAQASASRHPLPPSGGGQTAPAQPRPAALPPAARERTN